MFLDVDVALSGVPVNLLPLLDDTDFKSIESAVAYNAAGMTLKWNFVASDGTFTQTAVTPTTAGVYDWNHKGGGMYSIEIPASGGGSINNDTEGHGWFSGVATGVLPWRGPVIIFRAAGLNDLLTDSPYSTTRGLAGTALPNAAAEAAGGLYTRGSGAGQINQPANGMVDANVVRNAGTAITSAAGVQEVKVASIAAAAITAASIAADAITDAKVASDVTIASVTGSVGSVATGGITAASFAAGAIDAAAVAADAIGASELAAGAASEIASAVRTELTTELGRVDVAVSTRSTYAGADTAGTTTLLSRLSAARAGYLDNLSSGAVALESSLQGLITTVGASAAGIATAVWSATTRLLTAGTNIVLAKGTGVTGFNDLSAAQVNAEADTALADVGVTATVTGRIDAAVSTRLASASYTAPLDAAGTRTALGLASANLDTQLDALPTNAELATALGTADDAVLAAIAALNNLSSAGAQAAAAAALTAYGAALQSTLLTGIGYVDTEVAAIKAKTDKLTFTSGNDLDVNVQKVNDVALLGDGSATPWGPA